MIIDLRRRKKYHKKMNMIIDVMKKMNEILLNIINIFRYERKLIQLKEKTIMSHHPYFLF